VSIPNVLREIIAHKREELAARRAATPLAEIRKEAEDAPPARDFAAALRGDDVRIIAEIKRASPSAGSIRPTDFDPAAIARGYEHSGAAALSVLTDERFFAGRLEFLRQARRTVQIPVLRKDFVLEPWQIYEARAAGADAILLIVAVLEPTILHDLLALTRDLGMSALVETHTREEVHSALQTPARIIGVNNRDLHTFNVDLATTERLAETIPDERILVAESGVNSRADVRRLAEAGANAVLVGTTLMRAASPGRALRRLTGVRVKRWRR